MIEWKQMTMQEAENKMEVLREIFDVVRLLKGSDLQAAGMERKLAGRENLCQCYAFWNKDKRCENCISLKALEEKKQTSKIEFLDSDMYQVFARYLEIDSEPYVMEMLKKLDENTLTDEEGYEKLTEKLTVYSEKLYKDVLTGAYNRRYFEEKVKDMSVNAGIAVIDLDDFKHINDGLGHQYGDILLQQIAAGLTGIPGLRGHCYRMGGDEFAAILFVKREQFEWIRRQFDGDIKYWSCNRIKELSISYGYVSSSECQWDSMKEISDVADIRMYEEKAMYYKKNGVDRQGQPASYVALYRLYTQILRINLEKDRYKIINWEETKNKKKQDSIGALSEWFHNFEDIRLIHSDDLVKYLKKTKIEYLKKQFANKKKFVTITYRRKEGDGYKRITLEIIPEDENSQNTYEGFLYVKE